MKIDKYFTIPTLEQSTETLRTEAEVLGIDPTDENLRRIEKAIALHKHGMISESSDTELFYVRSQTEYNRFYVVLPHSGCLCMDAKRLNCQFGEPESYRAAWQRINDTNIRCKHEIAVMLYKQEKDDDILGRLNTLPYDVFQTINPDDYPDGDFPY